MSLEPRHRTLALVAAAELLGTSMWFSGTAAIPYLSQIWHTSLSVSAWLTMSVQLGFVAGALLAAVFNLPDVIHAPRLFVYSSLGAAATNAVFAFVAADHMMIALGLRFLTGAFLAGVYPVGMKILSGWFHEGRGTALGVLVGALTVGKALPYAVEGTHIFSWQAVVLTSSVFPLLGALLVAFVKEGPHSAPQPPLDWHQAGAIFRNRPLRLANFGYFGHMWELYSMWGWIASLLAASAGSHSATVAYASFAAIGCGMIGCVWAGRASDAAGHSVERVARRSHVAIVAMVISGICCLLVAVVFEHFWLLVAISMVWGVSVVADSAQFSTIVTEVSDRRYIGTALTLQTALGFLLTVVSIRVIGMLATSLGWRVATASMAIGPALGIVAMLRLQRLHPAASKNAAEEPSSLPSRSSPEERRPPEFG